MAGSAMVISVPVFPPAVSLKRQATLLLLVCFCGCWGEGYAMDVPWQILDNIPEATESLNVEGEGYTRSLESCLGPKATFPLSLPGQSDLSGQCY